MLTYTTMKIDPLINQLGKTDVITTEDPLLLIIGFALTESDGLLKKVSWKVWMILIFATVGFALLLHFYKILLRAI